MHLGILKAQSMEIVFRTSVSKYLQTNICYVICVYDILRKVRKYLHISISANYFYEKTYRNTRDIFAEKRYQVNVRIDKSCGNMFLSSMRFLYTFVFALQKLADQQSLAIAFSPSKWIFPESFCSVADWDSRDIRLERQYKKAVNIIYR